MTTPASTETVRAVLRKVLPDGELARVPRHPQRRAVVLAVLCLGMQRRFPYPEAELNELLERELERLHARVDHVTCRRYMVDLGFLKRDRAGTRYFVNYPKLELVLSGEAIASARHVVREVLARRWRSSRRLP